MEEIQRFTKLQRDIKTISDQKIRLEERYKTEKEHLEKLLFEITEKGYDPQKLTEIREEKEKLLKKQLEELETTVQKTQDKLNEIEVQL